MKEAGPVQAYVYGEPPPTGRACKVKFNPEQIVSFGLAFVELVSGEPAVNVTLPDEEHVDGLVTVTVYVVVAVTFVAIGLAILVLLKNVAGDQEIVGIVGVNE